MEENKVPVLQEIIVEPERLIIRTDKTEMIQTKDAITMQRR